MVVSGTILALEQVGVSGFAQGLTLTVVSAVCTVAFVFFLDRGRIIEGAAARPKTESPEPAAHNQPAVAGEGVIAGD